MATFLHGKSTTIFLDTQDVSSWMNTASYTLTSDTAETTAFGSSARSYIPSFPGGTVSLGGMFDGTANAIDAFLAGISVSQSGGGPPVALTIIPAGLVHGSRGLLSQVYITSYSVTSPVNDVVAVTADFTYSTKMGSGFLLTEKAAVSATGNGTFVDTGTVGSSGGVATLHVTTNTRDAGSITVNVQDATTSGGTYTTRGSFTAVNGLALSGQYIQVPVTTSLAQFVRAQWTVTGGTTGAYTITTSLAKT